MSNVEKHPGLADWLAGGQRGVSSNTMVEKLTGVKALGGWPKDHPYDPSDFTRCLLLLQAVPTLRPLLPEMGKVSKQWEALVSNWSSVEKSLLDEVGIDWRKGNRAPRTYALMKDILRSAGR